ncbi:hypothetical protein ALC62_15575 [Cyphomyrmex costatus]|uniref:Uncharacterized protein n=1 Tax=Cyphomyrmex costatus TaxID=456900 RepID=A0A195C127_9HYME|nr:hypothetical protein ALC62_15575 [Cyphomyrmex costatus]
MSKEDLRAFGKCIATFESYGEKRGKSRESMPFCLKCLGGEATILHLPLELRDFRWKKAAAGGEGRGESIPAMEPNMAGTASLVSSGRMSRHATKIDRRKLRKRKKNLIVLRMEMLESLDSEDGPRQAEREASRMHKWKEVGLIGRYYIFTAQLREASTSFTARTALQVVIVNFVFARMARSGSSRSPTFSVRSLAEINRLNLYLDADNRSRHHCHRNPGRHRTAVPNRCNDCRLDSVPCRRHDTCSKTTSAWTPRFAYRRCPVPLDLPCESSPSENVARDVVILMLMTKFMLIFMLQRTVYLHIGHIVIFVSKKKGYHVGRISAYLPSRVLFNKSVGQLSSSELSLHCDTPSQRDSRETYVLCHQCCDVCFLSWEDNPLRLHCLRFLLNQPNPHHRDVSYLICFIIVFILFENQSLNHTNTRFGIWHFRLIKCTISFISNV